MGMAKLDLHLLPHVLRGTNHGCHKATLGHMLCGADAPPGLSVLRGALLSFSAETLEFALCPWVLQNPQRNS